MKTLSKFAIPVFLSVLFAGPLATQADAEIIQIPVGSQGGGVKDIEQPRNGLPRAQVLARYGEPIERSHAVGVPPISRWEYEHYYVYFEHDLVLHTVIKHHPQAGAEAAVQAE